LLDLGDQLVGVLRVRLGDEVVLVGAGGRAVVMAGLERAALVEDEVRVGPLLVGLAERLGCLGVVVGLEVRLAAVEPVARALLALGLDLGLVVVLALGDLLAAELADA
jgi:hypothetical protein